jgi:D-beta-D-heptose 7-phosphate kinase/D-beta-D-heptose 1-phosphate adenosyltransferase
MLAITLGPHGMYLVKRDMKPIIIPARAREVYDVSGAGDTVIATLMLAVVAGADYLEAAALANYAAGVVVGKIGTATCTPAELVAAVQQG